MQMNILGETKLQMRGLSSTVIRVKLGNDGSPRYQKCLHLNERHSLINSEGAQWLLYTNKA